MLISTFQQWFSGPLCFWDIHLHQLTCVARAPAEQGTLLNISYSVVLQNKVRVLASSAVLSIDVSYIHRNSFRSACSPVACNCVCGYPMDCRSPTEVLCLPCGPSNSSRTVSLSRSSEYLNFVAKHWVSGLCLGTMLVSKTRVSLSSILSLKSPSLNLLVLARAPTHVDNLNVSQSQMCQAYMMEQSNSKSPQLRDTLCGSHSDCRNLGAAMAP